MTIALIAGLAWFSIAVLVLALCKAASRADAQSEAPLAPRPVSNLIVLSPRRTV